MHKACKLCAYRFQGVNHAYCKRLRYRDITYYNANIPPCKINTLKVSTSTECRQEQ